MSMSVMTSANSSPPMPERAKPIILDVGEYRGSIPKNGVAFGVSEGVVLLKLSNAIIRIAQHRCVRACSKERVKL